MQKKRLGKTDLEILPLVLGGNVFGWTANHATSFDILDAFIAHGGDLIDTADVYSGFVPGGKYGESERVIGAWMKKRANRARVKIATKVGYVMSPEKQGLSKKYILEAVEDSLGRLQTDYIDLYQSHRDDLNTPTEETLEAYTQLIKQGKVRLIGASQGKAERLANALRLSEELGLAAYSTLQPHYNLVERADYETHFKPICEAHGLGVISYFGLARGFLTGKYRSEADLTQSPRGEGVKAYLNERGFRVLNALDEIAQNLDSSPAQIALAWVMAQKSITAPIASATSVVQLEDLMKSTSIVLNSDALRTLDLASRS